MPKKFFSILFFTFLLVSSFGIKFSYALTQEEQEAEWRQELADTEADIAKWQAVLNSTKANTKSLQGEVKTLNAKIAQAKAFVKQRNVQIAQLDHDISVKNANIASLQEKIQTSHESIAQILKKTYEVDQLSLPELVLQNKDISDVWRDIDTFQSVNSSLEDMLIQVRNVKNQTEKEKNALDAEKDKQTDLKQNALTQQKQIQTDETQKEYLVTVSKTNEKTYTQILADRQAKAGEIRAKLFHLAGGGAAIPFGTALTYAQFASAKTGVSPAFLLAILTQESNLGVDVGSCYLTDSTTGAGVNVNNGRVWPNLMKASRDVTPFLDITSNLGFNSFKTVVSCPIPSAGGYGGAMGPAQFIASTWKLFQNRLQSDLDHYPNPWDPQDAFLASAMYLGDLGASSGTYSGELRAACKYYGSGGSTCSYGRSVMNFKSGIQSDIDYLLQYGISRR